MIVRRKIFILDNSKLDKNKKKLAERNIGLIKNFYKKNIKNIPDYKKEEFLSDLYYKYCRSALNYNEETGFKFSTFAYGGLNFCINNPDKKEIKTIPFDYKKGEKIKEEKKYVDKELLKNIFKKSKLSNIEKKILILYYYQDLSFIEIGERFNYHKEKVRRIRNRAIKKLIEYSDKRGFNIEDFIKV